MSAVPPRDTGCPAMTPPRTTAVGAAGPVQLLRADQRQSWLRGQRVRVEDYLLWVPGLGDDAEAVLDLVYAEFLLREELGERPDADEYVRRFPQYGDALRRQFRLHAALTE